MFHFLTLLFIISRLLYFPQTLWLLFLHFRCSTTDVVWKVLCVDCLPWEICLVSINHFECCNYWGFLSQQTFKIWKKVSCTVSTVIKIIQGGSRIAKCAVLFTRPKQNTKVILTSYCDETDYGQMHTEYFLKEHYNLFFFVYMSLLWWQLTVYNSCMFQN